MADISPTSRACWCGGLDLLDYSPEYRRCATCGTLVAVVAPKQADPRVQNDATDFYGKEYWLSFQHDQYGYSNIHSRSRTDQPERSLHWLRTLLKFELPAGPALELGSAHGGFVALMQAAGFDAAGLELSPWVVDFAKQTFGVKMHLGPIEDQPLPPRSQRAIGLFDVLEHLPDPVSTMSYAAERLADDGAMLVQTPCVPADKTYAELLEEKHPFLVQFKPGEHIYLFDESSARLFCERIGLPHIIFERPIFSQYDMFFVASRNSLSLVSEEARADRLLATPAGRSVLALLDLDDQKKAAEQKWADAENDRAARLQVIQKQGEQIGSLAGQINELATELAYLKNSYDHAEHDREERLKIIHQQGAQIGPLQAERNHLSAELDFLRQSLSTSDRDRAERLRVIESQGDRIGRVEGERNRLQIEIERLRDTLNAAEADRAERLQVIETQGNRIGKIEGEHNALQTEMDCLRDALNAAEKDRAERLHVIETQGDRIGKIEGEHNALQTEMSRLREILGAAEQDRADRLKVIHEQGERLGQIEGERNRLAAELAALQPSPNDVAPASPR